MSVEVDRHVHDSTTSQFRKDVAEAQKHCNEQILSHQLFVRWPRPFQGAILQTKLVHNARLEVFRPHGVLVSQTGNAVESIQGDFVFLNPGLQAMDRLHEIEHGV